LGKGFKTANASGTWYITWGGIDMMDHLIAFIIGLIIGFIILILIEFYFMWELIFRDNKKKVLEEEDDKEML
jgi:hypothetical protein